MLHGAHEGPGVCNIILPKQADMEIRDLWYRSYDVPSTKGKGGETTTVYLICDIMKGEFLA